MKKQTIFPSRVRRDFQTKMKLAQTNLSKLRRSDLFVENRSAQNPQLRRSGIFGGARLLTSRLPSARNGSRGRSPHQNNDVAPTELKNLLVALATKIPLLRSYEPAEANLSLGSACVPHALVNVPFTSTVRPDTPFDWVARTVKARRETRQTAPETGALPKNCALPGT